MLYLIGGLFAALVLMSQIASCEHDKVTVLEARIKSNQVEADRILKAKIAENSIKEAQDKAFAVTLQGDYDEKLRALRSLAAANRGVRLRDPGGQGCVGPGSGSAPAPGVPQDPAASPGLPRKPVELFLSETATTFLVNQAQRADEAALYAAKCREYVMKPTVKEQVDKLRGIK